MDKNEKSFHDCVPFNRKFTSEFEPSEGDNPVNQLVEVRKSQTIEINIKSVLIPVQVLNSDDFFLLLSNWTGLKLHPQFEGDSDEEDDEEEKREPLGGASRISVRRWKKVCMKRIAKMEFSYFRETIHCSMTQTQTKDHQSTYFFISSQSNREV